MSQLSPSVAATLAQAVYGVFDVNQPSVRRAMEAQGMTGELATAASIEAVADFEIETRAVSGVSGTLFTRRTSGFGMVLHGRGRRAGEVAVICRGTIFDFPFDWASNLNIALAEGPLGAMVHSGFNDVFRSMRRQVQDHLRGVNPTDLHVVGHSLGGALAHLFAAELVEKFPGTIRLYTFGCPRVGAASFASTLTQEIGLPNLHRVHALNDPVTMIPIHPFVHAPMNGQGLAVPGFGRMITADAHAMSHYIAKVEGQDWATLATAYAPPTPKSIRQMIAEANSLCDIPYSAIALRLLGQALDGLLKLAEIGVGNALTATFTVLDHMAIGLTRLASTAIELKDMVVDLIRALFRFVGQRIVVTAANLGAALIRLALDLVFQAVSKLARRALDLVG